MYQKLENISQRSYDHVSIEYTHNIQNSKLSQAVARTSRRPSMILSIVPDELIGSSINSRLLGDLLSPRAPTSSLGFTSTSCSSSGIGAYRVGWPCPLMAPWIDPPLARSRFIATGINNVEKKEEFI